MQNTKAKTKNAIKLIFNPKAGAKRRMLHPINHVSIEEIQILMDQYQMPVDLAPTTGPHHATILAREAKKQGYQMVVVAGGDGTVNEAANGLIDMDIPLGILPLGTYMNIAHMLSIPFELEKAVQTLKIGRTRKIDVGIVVSLTGEKLTDPYYFIEASGIGMEAKMHQEFKKFEKGDLGALFTFCKYFFSFIRTKTKIETKDGDFEGLANMASVANGPFSGAALEIAPGAKLNDHLLTVAIYNMTKKDFFWYFLKMMINGKGNRKELKVIKSTEVTIHTDPSTLVHADASLFGSTPVQYKIKPSCLSVICGFPRTEADSALVPKTFLDY